MRTTPDMCCSLTLTPNSNSSRMSPVVSCHHFPLDPLHSAVPMPTNLAVFSNARPVRQLLTRAQPVQPRERLAVVRFGEVTLRPLHLLYQS
jgi:hypothetical protein